MNWFQRYGIPGSFFWGFLILWIGALHNSVIPDAICSTNIEKVKIIVAIAAGTFLPIGYLMVVIGQLIYHIRKRFGMDTRARLEDPEIEDLYHCEREWQQEVASIRQTIIYITNRDNDFNVLPNNSEGNNSNDLETKDLRLLSEWQSKRMDMVAMNLASILAVIAAPFLSLLLTLLLPWQFKCKWFLFAMILSVVMFIICGLSRWILTNQLIRVERILLHLYNDPVCGDMAV